LVNKDTLKDILGRIPYTAELYWQLFQQGKPIQSRFSLKRLNAALPEMVTQVLEQRKAAPTGKKIFLFASLHYWIEHTAVMALALAAQGHQVALGFLPYADWKTPLSRFDLRRHNAYAKKVLGQAASVLEIIPLLDHEGASPTMPEAFYQLIKQVSNYDAQYTLQVEDIDTNSEIYQLRLQRNGMAAQTALEIFRKNRPDLVIVPNGTIQEMGVVYRLARMLDIPVTTYEFGDKRQHIWLAQGHEIMRQDTGAMWAVHKDTPLTKQQLENLGSLISARQRAALWENFVRLWQGIPAQGGEVLRKDLNLDQRPVVLLATNVLGDSLTLGRQVFSRNMSEWITRTVQYFADRDDIQLVIRIHPGEVLVHGLSMVEVVRGTLPELPEHIHLVGPTEKINTYDIVEVADLGLVYSTTVGMELAMSGKPAIVAGQTHYRGRGFTLDPASWEEYFGTIDQVLKDIVQHPQGQRLSREQVELAWRYAYHFFFTFPQPYPWHIVRLWEDYKVRPFSLIFSPEEFPKHERTLRYLSGEPINWSLEHD
jgi:hypothetical protein